MQFIQDMMLVLLGRQAVAYSGACPVPVSQTEPKWPCKWLFQWINDTRPRQLKICPTCSWFSADCNCPCPRKINVHQAMLLFASRDATEAIREGDESLAQTNKKKLLLSKLKRSLRLSRVEKVSHFEVKRIISILRAPRHHHLVIFRLGQWRTLALVCKLRALPTQIIKIYPHEMVWELEEKRTTTHCSPNEMTQRPR